MPAIRPLEPVDVERAGLDPTWAGTSGGSVHCAGLLDGDVLLGAVRIDLVSRTRRTHAGTLQLEATTPAHADALLGAACAFADRWTAIDRLEWEPLAEHVGVGVAEAHGFAVEVRRVERYGPALSAPNGPLGPGVDEVALARLRPGWVPRLPGPAPAWPGRHQRTVREIAFRPVADGDAAALRDLHIEETAVWGTLQTPWSNERFYAERHEARTVDNVAEVILADGEVAGMGGVHPTGGSSRRVGASGVMGLGMLIARRWQGCGLGGRLLDHLIARARERGARRIELGVWGDNTRAAALYASRGFRVEGTLRAFAIRAGGHADSVEMALAL